MEPRTKAELEKTLRGASDLRALLESTLDRSLTEPHIDANRYVKQYNHYRNELFSLLPNEDVEDVLTEMPLYIYTGDNRTDVANVKQQLVEVYLKTSQLVAYLQNQIELW
jgi:muconolactone delta-isomerase